MFKKLAIFVIGSKGMKSNLLPLLSFVQNYVDSYAVIWCNNYVSKHIDSLNNYDHLVQFMKMDECWQNNKNFHSWDWFIRTRLDLNFYNGFIYPTISSECIHTKLRMVSQLNFVTNLMLTYDYEKNMCAFAHVEQPCLAIDDQFAIIPQKFAAKYFSFAQTLKQPMKVYKQMCISDVFPENRLTSYILKNRIPICPIGHNESSVQLHFALNHEIYVNSATGDYIHIKQCGKSPLNYTDWITHISSY
jgi:hypothetical protein